MRFGVLVIRVHEFRLQMEDDAGLVHSGVN